MDTNKHPDKPIKSGLIKKQLFCLLVLIIFQLSLFALPVYAQGWWEMQEGKQDIANPFGSNPSSSFDLRDMIVSLIKVFFTFLALIFIIIIIIGGFKWMTSGGNQDKVGKAKDMLQSGIIGIIIILASYSILYFIDKYILCIFSQTLCYN